MNNSITGQNGLRAVLLTFLLAFGACEAPEITDSSLVTEQSIIEADAGSWLSHGKTYGEERFSPLDKISDENADKLGLHWSFDLGTSRGIEATPIVHDGILYVTATWNVVYALDAVTGQELWSYDPEVDRSRAAFMCCDVVNRGVAIWGNYIYTGTIDGRLIAIHARTGKLAWEVQTTDNSKPYTITGAPRIIKGKVLIGNGGAEFGVRGYISAYDAQTGKQAWRFYTVPAKPDPATINDPNQGHENALMAKIAKTWDGEYWIAGGGGTVWDSMAYDPDLDLLYIGVGNGAPWNHQIRSNGKGDNLFLSSIVALKPETGDYVWHFQTTPAETWDYTATQHMILTDLEIEGRTRKVIMQAPKNGFFYVIDRETGQFISANNYVPTNWATHIDSKTGRPVEIDDARWPGKNPYLQMPGPLGGHNWHPMSYSPDTGLVYIPAHEAPWAYMDKKDYEYTAGHWNTGSDFSINALPTDAAKIKALKAFLKGRLIAWDPVAQKPKWTAEHNGPWNGGVLSTAGNLVFQGTADARFSAYNASTGDKKWSFFTQTGIVAAPISYAIDGEQYIAVASGWGGSYALGFGGNMPTKSQANLGRVLVFKLGGTATLPDYEYVPIEKPKLPKSVASPETLALGSRTYDNRCSVCHGGRAFSSNLVPNLQTSPALVDQQVWNDIVIRGARAENGMPNFGAHLDELTSEAIRAYVIAEANSGRDKDFYDQFSHENAPTVTPEQK